jgi:HK97 family phage prohead protease
MEYKAIQLELKDIDKNKRTAVVAHAGYNNIDRTKDISRKGMFNKSWMESKADIGFYFNHKPELTPGKVLDVWEDEAKAFTKAYLGTHTLGEDTLKMLDEGIITKASFGYVVEKKNYIEVKGEKIRELKEVRHIETSVLTVLQANPLAGVISVTKSLDLANALVELKQTISNMERFCRNTSASDETIQSIMKEVDEAKQIISKYDTADTPLITEPDASKKDDDSLYRELLLFKSKIQLT